MEIIVRGKKIEIEDILGHKLEKAGVTFSEREIKDLLIPVLTTGDLSDGFTVPKVSEWIDGASEEEIAEKINRGMKVMYQVLNNIE